MEEELAPQAEPKGLPRGETRPGACLKLMNCVLLRTYLLLMPTHPSRYSRTTELENAPMSRHMEEEEVALQVKPWILLQGFTRWVASASSWKALFQRISPFKMPILSNHEVKSPTGDSVSPYLL